MKKFILLFIILILAAAATDARTRMGGGKEGGTELPEDAHRVEMSPENPGGVEAMWDRASLVVRAGVAEIREVETDDVKTEGSSRRTNVRKRMEAVLDVTEVYKGGFSGDDIIVDYFRSIVEEDPKPLDYEEGEDVVLFLSPTGEPSRYRTISSATGKVAYTPEIDGRLRAMQKETNPERADVKKKKEGKLTVNIMPGSSSVRVGEPLFVTVLVMNNSEKYVRIDGSFEPLRCIEIIGPDGKKATALRHRDAAVAPYLITLRPNHFVGARIDITRNYNVSKPGIYQFRAVTKPRSTTSSAVGEAIRSKLVSIVVNEK